MVDQCIISTAKASETAKTGASLANTIYGVPVTIALTGELGAGKTHFLQGFAGALGIAGPLTSPTYALEQRYDIQRSSLLSFSKDWLRAARPGMVRQSSPQGAAPVNLEFVHLDLYRLTPHKAREILLASEEVAGIRAIEWSERVSHDDLRSDGHLIHVHIEEISRDERRITVTFDDGSVPESEDIDRWRKDVLLPPHIIAHCDAVAACATRLAEALIARGHVLRPRTLQKAAQAHDLLRFIDFRDGAGPDIAHSVEETARWNAVRTQYGGMRHEEACAVFLRSLGYDIPAAIVAVHGLILPSPQRSTIEQKLLFYADKRVMLDTVVTLEERFADFAKRYGSGPESGNGKIWFEEAKGIEKELFPAGTP